MFDAVEKIFQWYFIIIANIRKSRNGNIGLTLLYASYMNIRINVYVDLGQFPLLAQLAKFGGDCL